MSGNLELFKHCFGKCLLSCRPKKRYSTKPREEFIVYQANRPYEIIGQIKREIEWGCAKLDLLDVDHKPERTSKGVVVSRDSSKRNDVKNMLADFLYQLKDYGIHAAFVAIGLLVEEFNAKIKRAESLAKRNLFICAHSVCLNVHRMLLSILVAFDEDYNSKSASRKHETIMAFATPKLRRLLEYLFEKFEDKSPSDICCLIFVHRRNSAMLLYLVIKEYVEVKPELSLVLKPQFAVGRNTTSFGFDGMAERRASKLAIENLKTGECNLIICSSVLEEGIDIQACNYVMALDPVQTFSSYVQTKGRARCDSSVYAIFVPSDQEAEVRDRIALYRATHEVVRACLIERMIDKGAGEEELAEKLDESIQPFVLPSGAKLFATSAVQLLNRYCGLLPTDNFGNVLPQYQRLPNDDTGNCRVVVRLPVQSNIADPIISDPMTSAREAKISAALKACIRLYQDGQFTDNLMPVTKVQCDQSIAEKLLPHHWKHHKDDVYHGKPGKNVRRTYDRLCPEELCNSMPVAGELCYAYEIKFRPCFERNNYNSHVFDMLRLRTNYGLLLRNRLPQMAEMPLFMNQGKVCATISEQPIKMRIGHCNYVQDLIRFHVMIFRDLLQIWKSFFAVDTRFEENSYLIVPLKAQDIDWPLVQQFQRLPPCRSYTIEERKALIHRPEDYLGKVVNRWYSNNTKQRFVVVKVHTDKSPQSAFDTDCFSSYEDYVLKKYSKDVGCIVQKKQFLLEVRQLTDRRNFIINAKGKTENKDLSKKHQIIRLIPELCYNCMYPGDMWLKALFLPCMLHRLHFLLHADNLRRRFNVCVGVKTDVAEHALYRPRALTVDESLQRVVDVNGNKNSLSTSAPERQFGRFESSKEKMAYSYFEVVIELITSLDQIKQKELRMWLENQLPLSTLQMPVPALIRVRVPSLIQKVKPSSSYNQPCQNDAPRIQILDRSLPESEVPSSEQCDLLAALTTAGCNDLIDMERLELLGDSFLKFGVSLYLANKFPKCHEGFLSEVKSKLVSNRNLVYCMLDLDIAGRICSTVLKPNAFWLPPLINMPNNLLEMLGEEPKLSVEDLSTIELTEEEVFSGVLSWWEIDKVKRIMRMQTEKGAVSSEFTVQDVMHTCLGKQILTDKIVADALEALLGVCVKSYGIRRCLHMLEFFDICKSEDDTPLNKLLDLKLNSTLYRTNIASEEVDQFLVNYRELEKSLGYKFRDRAYLLQALTHPSYPTNRLTGCYQELEFLGDAILDFLISCFIFERHVNMTPGKLTDLRSALVNNITLACVCVRNRFHHFMLAESPKLMESIKCFAQFQEKHNHCVADEYLLREGPSSQPINVPKALGDVVEALIASVYLDSCDLTTTWQIIYRLLKRELKEFSIQIPINSVRQLHEHKTAEARFEDATNRNGIAMVKCIFKLQGRQMEVTGWGSNGFQAKKAAANKALKILAIGSH